MEPLSVSWIIIEKWQHWPGFKKESPRNELNRYICLVHDLQILPMDVHETLLELIVAVTDHHYHIIHTQGSIYLIECASRGGRKGGANTAIPHMVAREYRNTASKFSQIPKPQLQMGKSWRCQYYKSSFQIEIILLCQCFEVKRAINIRSSHSFNFVHYMYTFT